MPGNTLDELKGWNTLELIAPDPHDDARQQYNSGAEQSFDINMVRKGGARLPVELHGQSMMCEGKRTGAGHDVYALAAYLGGRGMIMLS